MLIICEVRLENYLLPSQSGVDRGPTHFQTREEVVVDFSSGMGGLECSGSHVEGGHSTIEVIYPSCEVSPPLTSPSPPKINEF